MFASANPYLRFGVDSDPAAWAALALALAALLLAVSRRPAALFGRLDARLLVPALALTAGALSAGYVVYYLRGGPRIIDASYYYLEGRALARGWFSFPVPEPLAAFQGRFLLSDPVSGRLGVLFPPGYPAALALAFRLHAPLLLGPALAAALVPATYFLARALGSERRSACVAAGLSVVSAALRYHTADTMSHGLAALLLTVSVTLTLRDCKPSALAAGVALGWLIATRPVTGILVALCVIGFVAVSQRATVRAGLLLAGLLPGVGFLLAQQAAVSGEWLRSTQLAYYSLADGPQGCFRYGFGSNIGCLFEHGDYVRARLPHGYGALQALATTWRRLLVHSLDIANFAPLALGVPLAAWQGRHERGTRLLAAIVLLVMLGYAPFYFEGSFPGGGARFFAELLPLEHVLVARALCALGGARFAWPLALAGFALHTSVQHRLLRDREGGRPMFEPGVLGERGITRGLVFVSTDHGFALGHEPGQLSASQGVVVARERHDALDELLWEGLGRPASYRYLYDPARPNTRPEVRPWSPPPPPKSAAATPGAPRRIEAESLWPPTAVSAGWLAPVYVGHACASRGRGLRVHSEAGNAAFQLALPRTTQPTYLSLGGLDLPAELALIWTDQATGQHTVPVRWKRHSEGCLESEPIGPLDDIGGARLWFKGGNQVLDYIDIRSGSGFEESEKGVDN